MVVLVALIVQRTEYAYIASIGAEIASNDAELASPQLN